MGCVSCSKSATSAEQAQKDFGNKYKLGDKIGEGVFGQVRAVQQRATGAKFAVKIVRRILKDADGRGQVKDYTNLVKQEVDIWKKVGSHRHCVEMIDVFMGRTLVFIVMERCRCELLDGWEQRSASSELDMKNVFKEMLLGVEHVHRIGIVHRDIKPENYLWGGDGGNVIKLADYGLAANKPTKGELMTGVSGTAPYMSPEMLQGKGYDERTDVWSVGCTIYLMLYASFPYGPDADTPKKMKAAILAGTPPPSYSRPGCMQKSGLNEEQSEAGKEFIEGLLVRQYKERPFAEEALNQLNKRVNSKKVTSGDLTTVIRRARLATHDFKVKVDPTEAKQLDDLLTELGPGFRRSFSWSEKQSDTFEEFGGIDNSDKDPEDNSGPPMDHLESFERKTRKIRTAPASAVPIFGNESEETAPSLADIMRVQTYPKGMHGDKESAV